MTAPHIERMQDELAQLAYRRGNLAKFINESPIYKQLPLDERDLMTFQLHHMTNYHDVLETRIDLAVRSQ